MYIYIYIYQKGKYSLAEWRKYSCFVRNMLYNIFLQNYLFIAFTFFNSWKWEYIEIKFRQVNKWTKCSFYHKIEKNVKKIFNNFQSNFLF